MSDGSREAGDSVHSSFGQWQPIETAPKNGDEILLCSTVGDYGAVLCRWTSLIDVLTEREIEAMANDGMSEDDLNNQYWFFADFIQGGRLDSNYGPTHWMPLPSPPDVSKEG
jgi:hypothetical protein